MAGAMMYPSTDLWIQTYTGKRFRFDGPNSVDIINLEDIAHGLSMTCRYGGHCNKYYTVAEHSIHVMRRVKQLALQHGLPDIGSIMRSALMHDASEAYLVDLPSPLKRFIGPVYTQLEADTMEVIAKRYGLKDYHSDYIKRADLECLAAEAQQLFNGGPLPGWSTDLPTPWPDLTVHGWSPQQAKIRFLYAAAELGIED